MTRFASKEPPFGLLSFWKICDIRKHPDLTSRPLERGTYHGTVWRIGGPVVIGCVIVAATLLHASSQITLLYLLMIPIGRYGRCLEGEARADAAAASAADPNITPHP